MPSDAQTIEVPAQTRRNHPPKTIPGPSPRFRDLVSFLAFGSPRDLLSFYMDTARQYGDIAHFGRGSYSSYFVVHPDYVKHVLQDKVRNYPKKNRFNDMLKPLTGEGLLTSDGEVWRRSRRLSQPAFHRQRLAGFATNMTEATQAMLARWAPLAERGQALDVSREMQRVTLSIVGRALFSADIGADSDEMGRAVTSIFEHFNHRFRHPLSWPESVPTPRNRRFHTAIATIDSVSYRLIAEHRKADTDSGDLLSMLIAARDEETGQGLNDRQIRDEVGTFLGAGHETTAVTLAWVWYLLSKHPHVERQVHAEVEAVLGGRTPTVEDIPRLSYTRLVIQETLRLYPPAWGMSRGIAGDDTIDGYPIPAGALMVLSPYVTHRHPAFWDNPEGFEPERFTPERVAERPRYAYFPFGGGPRQCIGNEFALMETQLIIAMVVQRYRLQLVPGQHIEPDPIFTLRPSSGVQVTLHAR